MSRTRPASLSTAKCFDTAAFDTGKRAAISPAASLPSRKCSNISRRVGSDSARIVSCKPI